MLVFKSQSEKEAYLEKIRSLPNPFLGGNLEDMAEIARKNALTQRKLEKKYAINFDPVEYCDLDERRSDMRSWRKKVLARCGHKCVKCGSDVDLHVHHIKSYRDYPRLRTAPENGVVLCILCHHEVHHGANAHN